MNAEVALFIVVVAAAVGLIVLNLLIWLRPEVIFRRKISGLSLMHTGLATLLAMALFFTCFLVGVWISVMKLQGKLGVYL